MHLDPDSLNLPDGMDVTPPVCVAEVAKVSCGGGRGETAQVCGLCQLLDSGHGTERARAVCELLNVAVFCSNFT